jgi:hypothetical protein
MDCKLRTTGLTLMIGGSVLGFAIELTHEVRVVRQHAKSRASRLCFRDAHLAPEVLRRLGGNQRYPALHSCAPRTLSKVPASQPLHRHALPSAREAATP